MIKKISIALIVLGLLLAPAYWIYAKFYTGSQAMHLSLTPAHSGQDGVASWHSDEFTLHGDMAPLGLILVAQGHVPPGTDEGKAPKDLYTATLSRGDETAKPLNFSLGMRKGSGSDAAFREHLVLMHQVQPGKYRLEVTAVNPPQIEIQQMALELRQNLHEPDPRLVTGGVVLFILGILGLVAS